MNVLLSLLTEIVISIFGAFLRKGGTPDPRSPAPSDDHRSGTD